MIHIHLQLIFKLLASFISHTPWCHAVSPELNGIDSSAVAHEPAATGRVLLQNATPRHRHRVPFEKAAQLPETHISRVFLPGCERRSYKPS